MSKDVPVVLLSSDAYVPATAVTLQSMIDHYEGERPLKVYIMTSDMTEKNANIFSSYSSERVSVGVMHEDVSIFEQFKVEGYHVSLIDFLKIRLAELLPQYDTIINLDTDIIVRKDISPLMDLDLEGYYAAGVADMAAMEALQWHKRLNRMRYVNCGILVLNAKRMRQERSFEQCMRIRTEHPEYQCYEQDAQNDFFNDEVKYLPPKWNLMTYNLVLGPYAHYSINHINTFFGTKYRTFQEMEDDAAIIHLTNEFKPWTHENSYMSEEWMSIFERTKFSDLPLELKKLPPEAAGPGCETEGDGAVYDHVPHIVGKMGPFIKDWTREYTVLRLGRIPLIEKYKDGWRTRFKALGIPFLKREWTNYEERTYLFGVCVRAKPHWPEIKRRVDELFGRLGPVPDTMKYYEDILAQLELLEKMDHGCQGGKQELSA